MTISAQRLREILNFNAETGEFSWIKKPRPCKHGAVVGGRDGKGYWRISIDGKRYLAHRLAWLYVYGEWPVDEIDHIDGDRLNNSICNLREANRSQNIANNRTRSDCKHGFKGVSFHAKNSKWCARIMVGKKRLALGYYHSPEEAHAAYVVAARQHYGEYARFQ